MLDVGLAKFVEICYENVLVDDVVVGKDVANFAVHTDQIWS